MTKLYILLLLLVFVGGAVCICAQNTHTVTSGSISYHGVYIDSTSFLSILVEPCSGQVSMYVGQPGFTSPNMTHYTWRGVPLSDNNAISFVNLTSASAGNYTVAVYGNTSSNYQVRAVASTSQAPNVGVAGKLKVLDSGSTTVKMNWDSFTGYHNTASASIVKYELFYRKINDTSPSGTFSSPISTRCGATSQGTSLGQFGSAGEAVVSGLDKDSNYVFSVVAIDEVTCEASVYSTSLVSTLPQDSLCQYLPAQPTFCSMLSPTSTNKTFTLHSPQAYEDDLKAYNMYQGFRKIMAQWDCVNNRFSIVYTCDDCNAAYKLWACATAFETCTPFIKQCRNLCENVVRKCPPEVVLGFKCPVGLDFRTYGRYKGIDCYGYNAGISIPSVKT